jgi:hypothetical protein
MPTLPATSPADAAIQEKILVGLGELHALGISEVPRIHVALFAGYTSLTTNSFARNLKALIDDGVILKSSPGHVCLSKTGKGQSFASASPITNAEALERIQQVLFKVAASTKAGEICDILSDGKAWTCKALLSALGLKSATTNSFTKAKAVLRKLRLVTVDKDKLQLVDIAFPKGRPA